MAFSALDTRSWRCLFVSHKGIGLVPLPLPLPLVHLPLPLLHLPYLPPSPLPTVPLPLPLPLPSPAWSYEHAYILLGCMILGIVIGMLYWAYTSSVQFRILAAKNATAQEKFAAAIAVFETEVNAAAAASGDMSNKATVAIYLASSNNPSEDSIDGLELTKADNAAEYEAVCQALHEQHQLFREGLQRDLVNA